jgi:hypothetical protein
MRLPDSAEVYKHRRAVRPIITGRSNPVVGISDAVLLANTISARAARQAERQWKRSLSRGQRRKLRAA